MKQRRVDRPRPVPVRRWWSSRVSTSARLARWCSSICCLWRSVAITPPTSRSTTSTCLAATRRCGAGGNEYELVDQRSQNGSFVNGCRWPLYRLQDGDSVRVGGTTLRFFNSRPRTRDSLAEGIAHELNNAVASLSGNVDFLAAAYRGERSRAKSSTRS
ncbi:MAG: hypothetical protein DI536_05160 [Archangium gephyra]|uniref:FHA domain-containing protein n=1 Tax=Archangium gephyra TaxID=48 RepID=A0A2W5TRM7_9BACT|nr:MAG: hypothetical protein DI536_05160 [Archangium gephyra]